MNDVIKAKMETIATMRVAGSKLQEIATALRMSVPGVARILSLPDYKLIESQKAQAFASKVGTVLDEKAQKIRDMYNKQDLVPEALKGIIEVAQQRKDLRAAFQAQKELLDRDPNKTLPRNDSPKPGANAPQQAGAALGAEFLSIVASEADSVKLPN